MEGMGAQQQQQQEEEEGAVVKRRKVAAAAANVTMDLDVLDSPVCIHPLRPPVFQVLPSCSCLPCNLLADVRNAANSCTSVYM
jgi:hypothetical protein